MEKRKTKLIGRLWQAAIKQIRNWHFGKRGGKRILWHGDGQGAVPASHALKLIWPVHGKELKEFFERESAESKQCFCKMPYFSTWIIIEAEIEARLKEHERLKAEKYARFMQYFRANKEKR